MKTRRYTSKRDHEEIVRRQGGKCAGYRRPCGVPLVRGQYQIDHCIPVSPVLGGSDELENKQALCLKCHRRKTKGDVRNIKKVRHLTRGRRLSRTPFPGSRCTPWKRQLTSQGCKTVRRALRSAAREAGRARMIKLILRRFGYVPASAVRDDALRAAWAVTAEERKARRNAELLAAEWEKYAVELIRANGVERR